MDLHCDDRARRPAPARAEPEPHRVDGNHGGSSLLALCVLLILCGIGLTGHAAAATPPAAPAPPAPVTDELCAALPEVKGASELSRKAEKELRTRMEGSREAYQRSDYAAAINELRAAYQLKPVGEIIYSIAQACREAGRDEKALLLYEQSLRIDIDPSLKNDCKRHIDELHTRIAETTAKHAQELFDKKDYDGAIAAWQAAFQRKEDAGYVFKQAESHRMAGREDQALEAYERYITTDPNHARVGDAKREVARIRSNREDARASQLLVGGEYLKAAVAWDSAYQIQPHAIFLFRGAESFYRAGQLRESLASHQRFLRECGQTEMPAERQQSVARIAELQKKLTPVPVHKKAWFWVTIAGSVVLVGAAIGLGVGLSQPDPLNGVPSGFRRVLN